MLTMNLYCMIVLKVFRMKHPLTFKIKFWIFQQPEFGLKHGDYN